MQEFMQVHYSVQVSMSAAQEALRLTHGKCQSTKVTISCRVRLQSIKKCGVEYNQCVLFDLYLITFLSIHAKHIYSQRDDVERRKSEPFLLLCSVLRRFLPSLHYTFCPHTAEHQPHAHPLHPTQPMSKPEHTQHHR